MRKILPKEERNERCCHTLPAAKVPQLPPGRGPASSRAASLPAAALQLQAPAPAPAPGPSRRLRRGSLHRPPRFPPVPARRPQPRGPPTKPSRLLSPGGLHLLPQGTGPTSWDGGRRTHQGKQRLSRAHKRQPPPPVAEQTAPARWPLGRAPCHPSLQRHREDTARSPAPGALGAEHGRWARARPRRGSLLGPAPR